MDADFEFGQACLNICCRPHCRSAMAINEKELRDGEMERVEETFCSTVAFAGQAACACCRLLFSVQSQQMDTCAL